jgi:hypothetical protein
MHAHQRSFASIQQDNLDGTSFAVNDRDTFEPPLRYAMSSSDGFLGVVRNGVSPVVQHRARALAVTGSRRSEVGRRRITQGRASTDPRRGGALAEERHCDSMARLENGFEIDWPRRIASHASSRPTPSMAIDSVHLSLRPVRFRILVDPRSVKSVLQAIELNTSVWGGQFNPLIPVWARLPSAWRASVGVE